MNNIKYAENCLNVADEENRKVLFDVACQRLGDIHQPVLATAYIHENKRLMELLWSILAKTLAEKKEMLTKLIASSGRNPTLVAFFNAEERDNRYLKTALKLVMNDKEHFMELVEHDHYVLLFTAAKLGKHKLIEKYLKMRTSPLEDVMCHHLVKLSLPTKCVTPENAAFWRLSGV
jgi:hypothetical protein